MRVLVVGAGSIGGYFGGRLSEAGRDVTFLVRPGRAKALARTGLVVRSSQGNFHDPAPKLVTSDTLRESFDLIVLSCKAYDIGDAMESFAPAIGQQSAILPLLNGMSHLDDLDRRFGAAPILGGQCVISTMLDPEGRIIHLNDIHTLTFGERQAIGSARGSAIEALFAPANFTTAHSDAILQDMWEKWVFIASLAGITCLMRAPVGDIAAAGGADLAAALAAECAAIAAQNGHALRAAAMQRLGATVTQAGSPLTASMLRDIEQGGRIEAGHIIGDLLRRGTPNRSPSLLGIAYVHLKTYEAGRHRPANHHGAFSIPVSS
jgi:2-dehydropantoate 2-reductase